MEFGVGSIVDGKVTGITNFGAFVSLPEGKSGLVHISEIAHTYVNVVAEHLTVGQEVTVKVIGIDESNRINLSIKKAIDPPATPQKSYERPPRQVNKEFRENRDTKENSRPQVYAPRPAPKEPTDFEDKLKVFMQSSDNKLAELRHMEKKGSRRGRK